MREAVDEIGRLTRRHADEARAAVDEAMWNRHRMAVADEPRLATWNVYGVDYADRAGKTISGYNWLACHLDEPANPYRLEQRRTRLVRMARKRRRGWA